MPKPKAKAKDTSSKKKGKKEKVPAEVHPVGGITLPSPEQTAAQADPEPAATAALPFLPPATAVAPAPTALVYNPGETATSGDYRIEQGVTEVPEVVAFQLVGHDDSRTGTLSARGVVRLYHPHHPKSALNAQFQAEADVIGGRFDEKNTEGARESHAKRAASRDRG